MRKQVLLSILFIIAALITSGCGNKPSAPPEATPSPIISSQIPPVETSSPSPSPSLQGDKAQWETTARSLTLEGDALVKEGKFGEALEKYDEAVAVKNDYGPAYRGRGNVYMHRSLFDQALIDYKMAAKYQPENPQNFISLGEAYTELEHYAEALENFEKAINMDPDNSGVYFARGMLFHKRQMWSDARNDFDRAIKINPEEYAYYSIRANTYGRIGKPDLAEKDILKALEINPHKVNGYCTLASIYMDTGRKKEAIALLNHAMEIIPDSQKDITIRQADRKEMLYFHRGSFYVDLGEYDKALEDFNQALKLNPDLSQVYLERALLFKAQSKKDQAAEDAKVWLEKAKKPQTAGDYYNCKEAYEIIGDYRKAIENLNRSIKLDPKNPRSYFDRANLFLKSDLVKKPDQAFYAMALKDLMTSLKLGLSGEDKKTTKTLIINLKKKISAMPPKKAPKSPKPGTSPKP